jgi:hypothetical protein
MSNQKSQAEKENQQLQINKGIEFMLRRRVEKVKPRHGFKLSKTLNLLRRTFHLNLEFSWEVDKPTRE